ncbi:MAG: sigma-54-dependent Fis family transcriptional regulator [Acidobacteria bacterium]|nr:sigma-54-dependent Fis family transcriptional regulator [Acidobacteriota bacterium]
MADADGRSLVVIVDDDPDLAALAAIHVRRWGHAAHTVSSAKALRGFLGDHVPDVVLLDVLLGDADGSELVAELKDGFPGLPVIMITRSTSVEAAVRSMKRGAADYITKPLDFDQLHRAVDAALEVGRLARVEHRVAAPREGDEFLGILGASGAMEKLFQRIENLAPTDVSALILGETGTGKELVARAIHRASRRAQGPFVPVNAAAIPHDLIESALFGHEKGAFTGALDAHQGFCEQADGGTLFLDEIAEMDFRVQAKLLRFLQDHRVQRLGGRTSREVDVRVLAATNVDPLAEIARHRLREDLYYRLRVVSLRLPPLRDRGDDVELLARHFLVRAARRHGRAFTSMSAGARVRLKAYPWPGNVRELENVIEEAVVLHRGEVLGEEMLPAEIRDPASSGMPGAPVPEPPPSPWSRRERRELEALERALEEAEDDVEAAAEILGVSRATAYRRMKKYGLSRPA